jgi:DNA replication and repair protein RecF
MNFRNYQDLEVSLHPKLNLLIGPNAQGKTSILEALYCLSTTRSFRAVTAEEMIGFGSDNAVMEGDFIRESGCDHLRLELRRDKGKTLFLNGKKQTRLSAVLGRLPAVVFSPDDLFLIKGGPSLRRRFLNMALIQVDAVYLSAFQRYERVLKQRNMLLKHGGVVSEKELAAWDEPLAEQGALLIRRRMEMVAKLAAHASEALQDLTGGTERLEVGYAPSVPADEDTVVIRERILEKLKKARAEEMARGITTVGPHRDDLVLSVNGRSLKRFGSHGRFFGRPPGCPSHDGGKRPCRDESRRDPLKMRRKPPQSRGLVEVSQLLEGVLKKLGIRGEWDRCQLESKCREWLGEAASKALTAVTKKKGIVTLFFSHSAWLNEMNFRKKEGVEFLRREFPQMDLREMRAMLSKNPVKRN